MDNNLCRSKKKNQFGLPKLTALRLVIHGAGFPSRSKHLICLLVSWNLILLVQQSGPLGLPDRVTITLKSNSTIALKIYKRVYSIPSGQLWRFYHTEIKHQYIRTYESNCSLKLHFSNSVMIWIITMEELINKTISCVICYGNLTYLEKWMTTIHY